MCRKALIARSEDGVHAVESVGRRAPAPWLTLIARFVDIAEVSAACPLHQIAADRRHVAQLCGGSAKDRFAQQGIPLKNERVIRQRTVTNHRTDVKTIAGFDNVG